MGQSQAPYLDKNWIGVISSIILDQVPQYTWAIDLLLTMRYTGQNVIGITEDGIMRNKACYKSDLKILKTVRVFEV